MKRELPLTVALTLLAGSVAHALGLGPLERRSALNQPFEARIPLTGASTEDLDTLRVSLAGVDAFKRAGIERGLLATQLRFELVQPPTGGDFIRVTTRDPVGEPFVSFLIEVNWAAGRLFREYTALLDPPGFSRQALQVKAPQVAAPTPARTPPTPRAPAPLAVAPPPAPARPDTPDAPSEPFAAEVRVDAGDTLWGLAAPLARRAGVSTAQALVALWQANPDAFVGGNMNSLRAGAILRLPDSTVLQGLTNAEAMARVAQQNDLWQQYRSGRATAVAPAAVATPERAPPPSVAATERPAPAIPDSAVAEPELKLLAPAPEDAARAGEAGLRKELDLTREEIATRAAENDELRARLGEAERLIAQLERVLEVRSIELAALQQRLGMPTQAEPPPAAQEPPAVEVTPIAEAPAEAPPAADAGAASDDEALAQAQAAATVAPAAEPAVMAETPAESPDEIDPLAILERDLEVAEEGGDILADEAPVVGVADVTPAPAEAMVEPTVAEPSGDPVAPAAAEQPSAPAAPAAAAPLAPAPVAQAPIQPALPPPAAPAAIPEALQDALTRWADSVVPPAVSESVPGGPLAVLGALAAAVLGLLGLLGARIGRRRQIPVPARPSPEQAATPAALETTLPAPIPTVAPITQTAVLTGVPITAATTLRDFDPLTDVPEGERTLEATAAELAGLAPTAPEVDDLLTEVNVYLAYEQYDQAESLVRRAIAEAPEDPRRHQYLLDIFYAKGDAVAFEQAAATLQDLTGGTGPAWEDALKRWQELAPGRELFASGALAGPFEVAAQRTFVDLTAVDTAPPAIPAEAASVADDDRYSATATFAPGDLTLTEIAGVTAAPEVPPRETQSYADALDFDLGVGTPEVASDADVFSAIAAGDSGLDFATEQADEPLPAAATAMFDPTAGDEFTLVDITGGDADHASDLIDITSRAGVATSTPEVETGDGLVLDITGGDVAEGPSTVRLEPASSTIFSDRDDATRGLDPSVQLLDITATGARPGRDLQDLLDVSLEGAGLGDLLDVSGPAAGSPGPLTGSPPEEPDAMASAALDLPLEFDISGLSEGKGGTKTGAGASESTFGLPSLAAQGGAPLSLTGEQELDDTFDQPQAAVEFADDEGESLNDLAQALEETASRMRTPSPVPNLSDFSSTRAEIGSETAPGAARETTGSSVADPTAEPEFADLGVIDFDLLGGAEPDAPAAADSDSLSLEELEAALASAGATLPTGNGVEEFDPDGLSNADGWINLAHAYIEIGDPASAREELARVLAEGTPEQQVQARRLLDQIKD